MSNFAKTAIPLPLGPQQPRRLLDVIPPLPSSPDDPNPNRWLDGVTWDPWPCRALTVDAEDVCTADTLDVTPDECDAWISQTPFRISDAAKASLLAYTLEEVGARLSARYNRSVSAAFASELISGTASGGQSLSSTATAPNGIAFGGAAVPIWHALAVLEEEIAERLQGSVGYIHLPPGLLAQAVNTYGLSLNAQGMWETPAGNIAISDAGYLNPPPPTGEAASNATTDWVYASGPVWYAATVPILIGDGAETVDFTRNRFTRYIAGYGILVFDPCPVTAVLTSFDVNA